MKKRILAMTCAAAWRQHQGSRQQASGNCHVCEAADGCKVIIRLSYKLNLR